MVVTYNYNDLIGEIKKENLELAEEIRIFRSYDGANYSNDIEYKNLILDGYTPIIRWYYLESKFDDYLNDESNFESEDVKKQFVVQYEKDLSSLQVVTVADCLAEMEKRSSIAAMLGLDN